MATERNKTKRFFLDLVAKVDIPDLHKKVLARRLEDESLDFIARDLKLTRQRVGQIEEKATIKLNTYLLSH